MFVLDHLPLDHFIAWVPFRQWKEHKTRDYYKVLTILDVLQARWMKIFHEACIVYHFCPFFLYDLEFRLRAIKPHGCTPCIKELLIHNEKGLLCFQVIIDVNLNVRIEVKNREDSLLLVFLWKSSEAQHRNEGIFASLIKREVDVYALDVFDKIFFSHGLSSWIKESNA